MATAITPKKPTFTDDFRARIDALETKAHKVGLNLTEVCRQAGVSRATPDRWRRETPKTIALVTSMEEIVEKAAAKLARKAARA